MGGTCGMFRIICEKSDCLHDYVKLIDKMYM